MLQRIYTFLKIINHKDIQISMDEKKLLDDHRRNTFCSRGVTKLLAESQKAYMAVHVVFQNEAKNISRQNFVSMNISCKFENSTYNTFPSRGVTGNLCSAGVVVAEAYPCKIHSIHRRLSGGYNNLEVNIRKY